jgi:hypothetical protein
VGQAQAAHNAPIHLHKAKRESAEALMLKSLVKKRDALDGRIRFIQTLIQERESAMEQLGVIRDLAERSMEESEQHQEEATALRTALAQRDAQVAELEGRLQKQSERLQQIESTLKMLAEADEKV